MFHIDTEDSFPCIDLSHESGIVAIGGDVSPKRLLHAYNIGVFPWYNEDDPIIWYSPKQRMVLLPKEVKISKSMRKIIRNKKFTITFNKNFEEVIYHCKNIQRKGQDGTWLNDDLIISMLALHKKGIAKSVEVWQNNKLVGGLYGVDLGNIFCGESMFSLVSNASKIAFIALAKKLETANYQIIDCQVYNEHLASLGAKEIPRYEFKKYL
jgi:leucyl/phenylalanyl-tRNA--protein transferase